MGRSALLPRTCAPRPVHLALALAFGGCASLSLACETPSGHLGAVEGRVEVRASGAVWQPATAHQSLCPGDQVAVRGPGRALIVLSQDVLVRLDRNTTLSLPPAAASGEMGLSDGLIHVISRFTKRFGVLTPFVNALVDGTEFTVASQGGEARVVVSEGRVRTVNTAGELSLGAGEASATRAGGAPAAIALRPLDAVAWAIHYPQVVRLPASLLARTPALAAAQAAAGRGRFRDALAALDSLGAPAATEPAVAALKASTLLGLGQVDEARTLIARFAPEADASLAAVDALLLVARLETAAGEATARRAVALDANSAAARLALSYALQAARQLPEALAAAQEASRLAPDDALAWARRAELELGQGFTHAGADSAARALSLAPDTPRVRALAAFARLIEGETAAAASDFESALAVDDTEPLTHFGLGLAWMRLGQTAAGRREVEIAAMLDPGNAELRSYLGRAYMEEERSKVAGDQFALARRLDPASPTPWYFDAFRRLLEREPLAALADGDEALARNGNRAVLRAGTLLDQDRAARAASLGAAYQQVGFNAPAEAAAMNALEDDSQSAAGHRLLADAYAQTPRFEGARLSELLQAQLRQPIGQWPLPPQFVMPALPMLDGPRSLSPDEASAFFDRKPDRFAASLAAGSKETRSGSLLASHAWERAQLSFGAFDYRSSGLDARFADTHLAGSRLNAQLALTPRTMLFGEVRHTERSGGELERGLFDGQLNTLQSLTNDLSRVAVRHEIAPGEEFIAEVNTQRIREREKNWQGNLYFDPAPLVPIFGPLGPPFYFDVETVNRLKLLTRGLSLLYSRQQHDYSAQIGSSFFRVAGKSEFTLLTPEANRRLPMIFAASSTERREHQNDRDTAFGYAQWRVHSAITLHGGLEYVRFDDLISPPTERVNSKLGVVARPAGGSTLRAAIFQGVSGSKYDRENLAPTQFAGFNQVFDDVTGTRWRRAALGFEQRFGGGVTAGLEASTRRLDAPMLADAGTGIELGRWTEQLHRAHLAIPFGQKVALSAEWRHEEAQTRDNISLRGSNPYKIRSDLLPLRLWLKTGPADVLVENWAVRQEASQLNGGGSPESARSTFSTTNLRVALPLAGKQATATLGLYNVFDRQFRFQNTELNGDPKVPLFYPHRTAVLQGHFRF